MKYHTDGIHEFLALHGFDEAVILVSKTLKITTEAAKNRIVAARQNNSNEI